MKPNLTLCLLAVCAVTLFFANATHAQQGPGGKATELEIAQLPPYCQVRLRADRAQMPLWSERMGRENYIHLHHFCNGLIYFQRATTSFDTKERRRYLGRTVGAMDYVLERWPQEFPLYQEAETYKMQAKILSGSL